MAAVSGIRQAPTTPGRKMEVEDSSDTDKSRSGRGAARARRGEKKVIDPEHYGLDAGQTGLWKAMQEMLQASIGGVKADICELKKEK